MRRTLTLPKTNEDFGMIHPRMRSYRNGVAAVEFAVTSGVTLFLIIGLIVGGLGVYRYQEVAHLARDWFVNHFEPVNCERREMNGEIL